MKVPRIVKTMGYIDDNLVSGAEAHMPQKKKPVWLKLGAMAACLCLVVFGAMTWNGKQVRTDNGTLLGADKIYPTIMVQGKLYEWRKGAAICDELPDNCVYYGELTHVDVEIPHNDCEFVSVFSVSGQVYTIPQTDALVYLCLTTDWMDNTVVVFDFVEPEK